MDLIVWRHAEAEDGVPDLERRLTGKGRKQGIRAECREVQYWDQGTAGLDRDPKPSK